MKNLIPELVILLSSFSLLIAGVFFKTFNKIINYIIIVLLAALILVVYFNFTSSVTLFGNSYTIDPLSNFMKILVLISVLFTMLISNTYLERLKIAKFEYPIILLLSTLGMFVMISANNLIVFYLGLELQSLCLYVLAAINTKSLKSSEAGLKYFVLGSLSSGLLLYGCSIVYGFTGSVDYSEIAKVATEQSGALKFGLVFILCGIAFKISAVPFHMWAPDVYEGSPTSVTTFFAMAPKVAAIAALIKFLNVPYANFVSEWRTIVIVLSIASMFLGAVAAIGQSNLKRLMAYSSIGHVGFILAGLAIATPESLSAVLVYLVIYVFMNIGVFACIMSLNRNGVYFENISDLSGLSKHHPLIAICLTILTFSLAGIPPLAGFFAKFYIFLAIIQQKIYYLAVVGLLSAVIAAFYYLRIVKVIYFDAAKESYDKNSSYGVKFSLIVSTVVILFYFIDPSTLNTIAESITKNIK
jgi:NADH-quinone oxidoreductase subunit N